MPKRSVTVCPKNASYPRHVFDRYHTKLETWRLALLLVNTCLATGERYAKDDYVVSPCPRRWERRLEDYVDADVINQLAVQVRDAKRSFRTVEAMIPSSQIDKGEVRKVCLCGTSCVFDTPAMLAMRY